MREDIGGAVGGMVIDHDDIVGKRGLLLQSTLHCIGNSLGTIVDRNDDGRLDIEGLLVIIDSQQVVGVHQGTNSLQMTGCHLLHLNLNITIGGVHIVELLLAGGTHIALHLGIEQFIQVQQFSLATQIQAQVVESTIYIMRVDRLMGPLAQPFTTHQPQSAEVEIIANRSQLIIDDRMSILHPLATVLFSLISVCIDHGSATVGSHLHQAFQGALTQFQRRVLDNQCHISGLCLVGYLTERIAGANAFHTIHILHQSAG